MADNEAGAEGSTGGGRWRRDLLLVATTAVVVLGVVALVTRGDGDSDGDDGDEVATDTTDDVTTTTEPPETTESTGDRVRTGNFEDGLWAVGTEIQPGRYIVTGITLPGCSWARLSDVSGDNVIVAEERATNQVVVDILATDAAFRSDRCGVWEVYEPRGATPLTTVEDGDWVVGDQLEPGTYQSDSASSCGWTHASGFEHTAREVIESVQPEPRARTVFTVQLADGERFSTRGCATWTKTG